MPGGKKYTADKPGTTITVEDHHAKQINKSSNGQKGIVTSGASYAVGTRDGRRCTGCGFLAQRWSHQCPRCGGDTEVE
jgi:rubrerythrin